MRRTTLLAVMLLPVGLWWGASTWDARRFEGAGPVAPDEPTQRESSEAPFQHGAVQLIPKAEFSAKARVLSVYDYREETDGDIVPVDLVLAWGALSDADLAVQLAVHQHKRYFSWHAPGDFALPRNAIIRSTANMHMVPATDAIRDQLLQLRRG